MFFSFRLIRPLFWRLAILHNCAFSGLCVNKQRNYSSNGGAREGSGGAVAAGEEALERVLLLLALWNFTFNTP